MSEYICPQCKNPIYDEDALLCHFCGESLKRSGSGVMGKMKYPKPRTIFIVIVVIMILSFALLFLR